MGEEDVVCTDYDYEEDSREWRYYLGDGLWSHPETGGTSISRMKVKIIY